MQPARRRIEPPPSLDPALAEFVAELARAAVRRQKRHEQGGPEAEPRKRVLLPPSEEDKK